MNGSGSGNPGNTGEPDSRSIAREADQRAIDVERTAADADQGAADADQTASDTDQTAAERDEADAARDQLASEQDQASANHRWPVDVDENTREAYEASRATREASRVSRLATHVARGGTARSRADTSAERDATATTRDETARRRDVRARAVDRSIAVSDAPLAEKLEQVRARAATARARAAADRDRAARDRAEASRERARLEAELQSAHLDDLTGVFRREMGRLALSHEIDRARRGDGRFVIAFVDVDGLKRVNDQDGHAAGDHVLRTLASTLRAKLRSFDPIVRHGGDEFVCGLGSVDLDEVERRFDLIGRSVQDAVGVGISVGLASLASDETLDQLTARADAALLDSRKGRGE